MEQALNYGRNMNKAGYRWNVYNYNMTKFSIHPEEEKQ